MIDMPAVLDRRAAIRPSFYSEADFLHALASQIKLEQPGKADESSTSPMQLSRHGVS